MNELSEEDRQRIEQIARNIASHILGIPKGEVLPDDTILIGAREGAEYATLYERQQKEKQSRK